MLQLFERFKMLDGFRSVLFLDPGYYRVIFKPLSRQSIYFRSLPVPSSFCISVTRGSRAN